MSLNSHIHFFNSFQFNFILLYFKKKHGQELCRFWITSDLSVFFHHGIGLFYFIFNSIIFYLLYFKKEYAQEHCQFWIISGLSVFFHYGLGLFYFYFSFQSHSIQFNFNLLNFKKEYVKNFVNSEFFQGRVYKSIQFKLIQFHFNLFYHNLKRHV